MTLFNYDYDDLAQQIQTGLERLAVNFLRSHGARIRRDLVDFHGYEQVELELSHGGHALQVRQIGRPRSPGVVEVDAVPGAEEVFETTFDGWPAADVPRETIARWLAELPVGQAPPEPPRTGRAQANPFTAERPPAATEQSREQTFNPFLADQPRRSGSNPFVDTERERKRQEVLRQLKGDEEE